MPQDRSAVSNMPEAGVDRISESQKRVRFAPTPKIVLLLLLGVGDLERITTKVDGVEMVCSRSAATPRTGASRRQRRAAAPLLQRLLACAIRYRSSASSRFRRRRLQRHGELGAILYFEEALLIDPRCPPSDRQACSSSSRTRWLISGSAISSRRSGGTTSGSTRVRRVDGAQGSRALSSGLEPVDAGSAAEPGSDGARRAWDGSSRIAAIDTTDQPTVRSTESPTKGRAVIRMIEQYVGAERFRDGIRATSARTRTATPTAWALGRDRNG